jgi:hypothetical protein
MDISTNRVTRSGRVIRAAVTTVIVALLLAASLWGGDDDFPLGPQLQFANTDQLNAPVVALRVEAVDTTGARFELTENSAGIRRAEIEAQVERFKANPALLISVGDAFARRNPNAPPLVEIDLIQRDNGVKDGRPTRQYTDHTLAVWRK